MRRIAICLRTSGAVNVFRRVILNSLRANCVDRALLCSGFFQEDHRFSAAADLDLFAHRSSPLDITVLGLYSYSWKQQYAAFYAGLLARNPYPLFFAQKKRIPGMHWHAKVFLAKSGDTPLVAIVGSSNVTRRAFGAFKEFNYECDVVFWEESCQEIDVAVEAAIGGDAIDRAAVIVANYDEHHPANRPIVERLRGLEEEILSRAVSA